MPAYKEFQNTRMDLSTAQVDLIITAMLNNGRNKKFVSNVRKLFNAFSEDTYKTDMEKEYRVYLTKVLAKSIIENNVDNKDEIITMTMFDGKFADKCNILIGNLRNRAITDKEVIVADELISRKLKFAAIFNISEPLTESLNRIRESNFEDFDKEVEQCESLTYQLSKTLADVRDSTAQRRNTITLNDTSEVLSDLDRIIKDSQNPSKKVRTGIQCLNLLLNGGFESGRCYCVLGVAKGWKSGFLVTSAIYAKKYNDLVTKDPEKTPIILYLTLENTKKETEQRLLTYAMGNSAVKIKEKTKEELYLALTQAGIVNKPDDSEKTPAIMIRYAKPKSMSPNDISLLIDDLAKEGKEVVFLIVDYLKRLKADERNKEARIEYGNIADELTTLAKDKDIPVLVAMQLNREAIKMFTDSEDNFQQTLENVKKINSSNIGESIDVVQNVDCVFSVAIVQNKKRDETGNVEHTDSYLQLKMLESRTGTLTANNIFYQRFVESNMMRLIEDCNATKMEALTAQEISHNDTINSMKNMKLANR